VLQGGTEHTPSFVGIATIRDRLGNVGLQFLVDFAAQSIAAEYVRNTGPDGHG
jgi:hypothetical protein